MRRLTPEEIADQRRGGTRIAVGLWIDRFGSVHVSITELLEAFAFEDTPENRAEVERVIRQVWAEKFPGVPIIGQGPIVDA